MGDVVLVAATVVFIVICVGYVNWCDRIIGPDDFAPEEPVDVTAVPSLEPEPPAPTEPIAPADRELEEVARR